MTPTYSHRQKGTHPMTARLKIHESITHDRVEDAVDRRMLTLDNPGFCTSCGFEQDGCEPDARGYRCESYDAMAVHGADELLLDFYLEVASRSEDALRTI